MKEMELLNRAIRIAIKTHEGQTDKSGSPYITHPLRVMNNVGTLPEKIAAVLHDVVEDTYITLDDLSDKGFPPEIVEAVNALTRRKDEKYEAFIVRAGENPIARSVKIEDVRDNMDVSRLPKVTDKDVVRLNKYINAYNYLSK